ncbi:GTP 3',8-cyclase MoaA [Maricaulis sp. MIT060901]|uniref:GTP 3',8-cyclase MoaA n=1 Tax=Maricaulis sp. MIT060901 TaxID=3096993 RepID=UPI003999757D
MDTQSKSLTRSPLIDAFGRQITYLRLSVTDRCDLRCHYCMDEQPEFLPKKDLLSYEELAAICDSFIARGVSKIRITGGEPLVRRDVITLIEALGQRLGKSALSEIALTTNGTLLERYADQLAAAGVKRINVSLDTLDEVMFRRLTRNGRLADVLRGIDAARKAGLHVKINAVALKGENEHQIADLMSWAHGRKMDMSLIEVMPVGEVETRRSDQFLSLAIVRSRLEEQFTLQDIPLDTGGPSRYVKVAETGGRLGFISPLSHNFCASCNRVRVTCTGTLFMCLGKENSVDLRAALRNGGAAALNAQLDAAMQDKPERHDFDVNAGPAVSRSMARTGG